MSEEKQPKDTAPRAKPGPNSPAEKAAANWEMPAPIFRVSEGVTVSKGPAEIPPEKGAQIVHEPLPDSPPTVKPLPDDPAQPTGGEVVLAPVPEKKPSKAFLGLLLTAVGIVGMILFAAALIAFVYFYFFYKSEPGSGF